jgi:hypothetical protein
MPPPCGCAAWATLTSPRARARGAPIPERLDAPREAPPLTRPPPQPLAPTSNQNACIYRSVYSARARGACSARAPSFPRGRGTRASAAPPAPPTSWPAHSRYSLATPRRPHGRPDHEVSRPWGACGERAPSFPRGGRARRRRTTCTIPSRAARSPSPPPPPPQASRMTLPIACAPAQPRRARNLSSPPRAPWASRALPDARPYSLHALGGAAPPQ